MSITYPLSLPTSIGIANIRFTARHAIAIDESPFTFRQQIFSHPGEVLTAAISIGQCKREEAEEWIGFLLALRGQAGTFLLGDPNAPSPQGTITGTPRVNGANQTGDTLNIDGVDVGTTLKAGDYIQLGTGLDARLYKVILTETANASGEMTLNIWPKILQSNSPSNNQSVIINDTVGLFRLAEAATNWEINSISSYGITFNVTAVVP